MSAAEQLYDEAFDGPEFIEDELKNWIPEIFEYSDPSVYAQKKLFDFSYELLPSEFTNFAFRMPNQNTGEYESFSFDGRKHLYAPYDTPAKRVLMVCARQVEKSTLLGNKAICYCCLIPAYKVLYVSPSATQTKTFSSDRVKEPLETSSVLKSFTTNMLSQNVFEKQFINRSKITLRYAFLNADRTRGIPANGLFIDEFQDVLADNIPVIEQCTSHSPELLKRFIYSGTPKTLDNNIEYYRSRLSTQGEWVVPCDAHGGDTGRYWNILGEKNIGKKGLSCEKCGKLINPMHEDSQWAFMVKDATFESYRVPQLMVPWIDWKDILHYFEHYPRSQFYNEVLGISFDSGLRPLTQAQIKACCIEDIHMADVAKYEPLSFSQDVFVGIDWGSAEHSYTVLSLGTYVGNKFRIFYIHRFVGEDTNPELQLERIAEICKTFNARIIGTDYGGGFHQNDFLLRRFGPERLQKFQYVARLNAKVRWDAKLLRWLCHRTEVMSAIMNSIKRGNILEFPRWKEFRDPFAQDMLNIYSEYSNTLRMITYDHSPGKTDDSLHSILYCFLASMIIKPRPDVIAPRREDPNSGYKLSSWNGPTYQG